MIVKKMTIDNQITKLVGNRSSIERPYVKRYNNDIDYMKNLSSSQIKVLYSLFLRMSDASDKYGMCVTLNPLVKKDICKEHRLKSIGSVNNALSKLVQEKILKRMSVGMYQVNPYLFGKGDWECVWQIRVDWMPYLNGTEYEKLFPIERD